MSDNGSQMPPPEMENLEVAPDVALFIISLEPAQRTFLIRAIAPSKFNLAMLWDALGTWWNSQDTAERMAHVTASFNQFYQGREKQHDDKRG